MKLLSRAAGIMIVLAALLPSSAFGTPPTAKPNVLFTNFTRALPGTLLQSVAAGLSRRERRSKQQADRQDACRTGSGRRLSFCALLRPRSGPRHVSAPWPQDDTIALREGAFLADAFEPVPGAAMIHAIFRRGVFEPITPVDLPDECEVEFEPALVGTAPQAPALDAVYAILAERYRSGEHDTAARHSEHQP